MPIRKQLLLLIMAPSDVRLSCFGEGGSITTAYFYLCFSEEHLLETIITSKLLLQYKKTNSAPVPYVFKTCWLCSSCCLCLGLIINMKHSCPRTEPLVNPWHFKLSGKTADTLWNPYRCFVYWYRTKYIPGWIKAAFLMLRFLPSNVQLILFLISDCFWFGCALGLIWGYYLDLTLSALQT